MKSELNLREMIALGFMAFALFLGAGNIIFPPFIGIQAGSNVWTAVAGFLLTGVGLPVLAIIALARAGGDLGNIISPVGHVAGNLLIIACYLFIGPLFASPGRQQLLMNWGWHLWLVIASQHWLSTVFAISRWRH